MKSDNEIFILAGGGGPNQRTDDNIFSPGVSFPEQANCVRLKRIVVHLAFNAHRTGASQRKHKIDFLLVLPTRRIPESQTRERFSRA